MSKLIYYINRFMSFVVPQNEKIIVLESNPPLQDNTGALFKEMLNQKINERYKIIWLIYDYADKFENYDNCRYIYLSTNSNFSKLKSRILESYWISRGKYYIFSHRKFYSYKATKGKIIMNLTHGVPIKDSSNKHMSQDNVTDIITTSRYAGKLRSYTYGIDDSKIRVLGYPRNDFLKVGTTNSENYIVWLPTYRTHHTILKGGEFDYFPLTPSKEDFELLDSVLLTLDVKLYIKPHPAQKINLSNLNLSNIIMIEDDYLIKKKTHLYEFLNKSSSLITDYSSVYLDYLLTDKPIIFTFDDLASYTKDWGFTVDDIDEVTPGDKVYSINDLITSIKNLNEGKDLFIDERNKVRNLFHEHQDNESSKRVIQALNL